MAVGRQFGREATIYLAGFVGAGIMQFLAIPVYSRALGPDQYGYLTLTIAATTVLSGVMVLGGDVALARFWVDAPDEEERRILASTWIGFLTAWSVVVSLVAVLVTPWLADALRPGTDLAVLMAIGFAGLVPAQLSRMLAQILRNRFRPVPFAVTTVLVTVLNVALGIVLGIVWDLGVRGIVLGTLVGESLGALIRLPLVWRTLAPRFSRATLRPLLRFGVPLVPASVAAWVFTGADRLVIGAHASQTELGAYGLAATLIGPFTVFTLAMGQAWIPRVATLHSQDPDAARRATSAAIRVALAGLGTAALVAGTAAPWLVSLVGGAAYSAGAAAVPFLALGAAFYGSSLFTTTGLTLAKRTGPIPLVTVAAALVDLALLAVLVPRAGMVGASVAVATAYLCLALGSFHFAHRAFPLVFDRLTLVLVLLILVGQSTISTRWPGSASAVVSLVAAVAAIAALVRRSPAPGPNSPAEVGGIAR